MQLFGHLVPESLGGKPLTEVVRESSPLASPFLQPVRFALHLQPQPSPYACCVLLFFVFFQALDLSPSKERKAGPVGTLLS